jgi:pre-mRNA-splicing factor CWC22
LDCIFNTIIDNLLFAVPDWKDKRTLPSSAVDDVLDSGVYVPPHKLRRLQEQTKDKSSLEYQRMNWEALKKSINGIINKVNVANISNVIPELFNENLIRGRGLFARAIMKAQAASPAFTNVYAALLAVINTKMPEIGELVLKRLVIGFRKAYQRNDKMKCIAFGKFIAHLVNQLVAHEILAGQLLGLLLEKPTDDSVELAVAFIKECGQVMNNIAPKILYAVFERLRSILHEGKIDKRVQYMIEGLFEVRKKEFADFPGIIPELDLVESEDQITHETELDQDLDPEEYLDYFHYDEDFEENEEKYARIKREILGEESDADDEASESDQDQTSVAPTTIADAQNMTEEEMLNFKRNIYLTIMSSLDYEECAHKLLKNGQLKAHEMELCSLIIECCSQERTFLKYYGLLGQRFCQISRVYQEKFEECFKIQYSMVHRLESNKLRNVALFFSYLLYTNSISWAVFEVVKITPEDTTSASRIFLKILFQDLAENMRIPMLKERLKDEDMKECFSGLFPTDTPKNTRFAINYWTSIELGALTLELREHLKNAPRVVKDYSSDSSSTSSSSISSSDSSSDSDYSSSSSE